MQPSEHAGSIYDLGYRRYDGPRLGREHAFASLYLFSLRGAFGLGRRHTSKIIPIALVLLAAGPAFGQLAVAAIAPVQVSIIRPENYFDFVQVILAVFCAAVAPELFARDQRMHTLPLYFARGMLRRDYTLAKLAALATALLFITLIPQALLFAGNALVGGHTADYLRHHWLELPQAVASGLVVAVYFAALSAAIGAQTPRRAYSTVAIVAVLVMTALITAVINETVGGVTLKIAVLLTPFEAATGTIRWIFASGVMPETNLGRSGIQLWLCFPAVIAMTALAGYLALRRFERLAV